MSIKARLLIIICVAIAAAFTLVGVVTVTVIRARMIERVDQTLLAAPIRPDRIGVAGSESDGFSQRATATLLLDTDGDVIQAIPSGFVTDPDPLPNLAGRVPDRREMRIVTAPAADESRQRFRVLLRPVAGNRYLAVAASLDTVDATTRGLIRVIAVTGLAVLALVVLVVWFTLRRGFRPIDDIVATAGLIASGDLSQRVETAGSISEVGQLGRALNIMLGRIEASFAAKEASEQRLRQFVADASHELRTPLTSIRGYAELYRSGAASSLAERQRVIARIESEGARMGQLVDDLLLLARLDQGRPLERETVDLSRILDDAVSDARVLDPERPIAFEPTSGILVPGDANRLRQVFDNLLANARTHTDPGTPVRIRFATTAVAVTVHIHDDGPGIALDDADRVFDRFYRVDSSRSRASGGTGLGLAIVASIVAAHGGSVALDTAPGRGTTVSTTLPR